MYGGFRCVWVGVGGYMGGCRGGGVCVDGCGWVHERVRVGVDAWVGVGGECRVVGRCMGGCR